MKTRKSMIIVIVLLISVNSFTPNLSFAKNSNGKQVPETNYVDQEPIIILNDDNFTDYGFPGSGTLVNPYRIEDLIITSNGEYSISVQNTTSYFIIRNCFLNSTTNGIKLKDIAYGTAVIEDNHFSNFVLGIGLYIENSSSCEIINNSFSNTRTGVMTGLGSNECLVRNNSFEYILDGCFLMQESNDCEISSNECFSSRNFLHAYHCNNLTVVNNYCNDVQSFVYVGYSELCNISNNICYNVAESAIIISKVDICNISSNICNTSLVGFRVISSSKVEINSNIIDGGIYGLGIYKSRECYIKNNNFTKCGISIEEMEKEDIHTWILENNHVNGKTLGFYKHKGAGFIIEGDYGQLILLSCSKVIVRNIEIEETSMGIGVFYCFDTIIENCTINNTFNNFVLYGCISCNLTSSYSFNSTYGILIDNSENCFIINTECYENDYGIRVRQSEYCSINKNSIYENTFYGIEIHYSNYCNITENQCYQNTKSIYLHNAFTIIIENNEISANHPNLDYSKNSAGIYSTIAMEVTITQNSFTYNNIGVFLSLGRYFTISDNEFKYNEYGIDGFHVLNSEIKYNLFEESEFYALTLGYSSTENTIHHNAFINNNNGKIQALDNGSNNTWYEVETEEGNYWSDYQGTGNYSIDGEANSYDLYPLAESPISSPPNNNIYYAFFSLLVLIPITVLLIKKYRIKKN